MVDILFDALTYVVYVVGILLIIGLIALYLRRQMRRDRAWPAAAESLGMQYTRFDDTPLDVFAGFKTFDALGFGPVPLQNLPPYYELLRPWPKGESEIPFPRDSISPIHWSGGCQKGNYYPEHMIVCTAAVLSLRAQRSNHLRLPRR